MYVNNLRKITRACMKTPLPLKKKLFFRFAWSCFPKKVSWSLVYFLYIWTHSSKYECDSKMIKINLTCLLKLMWYHVTAGRATHTIPWNSEPVFQHYLSWCSPRPPQHYELLKSNSLKWIFRPSYRRFLMEMWNCCCVCADVVLHALIILRNLVLFDMEGN